MNTINKKLQIVFLCLVQLIISFAVSAEEYYYDNFTTGYGKPITYYFDLSDNESIILDPTHELYKLTLHSDDGFGFYSEDISFFVPNKELSAGVVVK